MTVTIITSALQALYGTSKPIGNYIGNTVEAMKKSENEAVSRTGLVIESAQLGFGIGYTTPIVIVALGQMILGNPLSAVVSAATMAVNPVAITCAAVGAIYYGWHALSESERNAIVARLSAGLDIGTEIVRAIAAFVATKFKELSSSEMLAQVRGAFNGIFDACTDKISAMSATARAQLNASFDALTRQLSSSEPKRADTRPRALQQQLGALIEADRSALPPRLADTSS